MPDQRRFLLDSNVFIQASRRYYGFDICPGFWVALVRQHRENRIFSIDHVKTEITKDKDKLKKWALSKAPDTFFKKTNEESVINLFGKIVQWVQRKPQYKPEAKAEFAQVADGWLIAYAKTNGLIVVTHEIYTPDVKIKVPIPNVCREFEVEYVDTFKMLRELGIKFGLRKV